MYLDTFHHWHILEGITTKVATIFLLFSLHFVDLYFYFSTTNNTKTRDKKRPAHPNSNSSHACVSRASHNTSAYPGSTQAMFYVRAGSGRCRCFSAAACCGHASASVSASASTLPPLLLRPLLLLLVVVSGSGSRNFGVFVEKSFGQVWQFWSWDTNCGETWRWVTKARTVLIVILLIELLKVVVLLVLRVAESFTTTVVSWSACQTEQERLNRINKLMWAKKKM